MTAERERCLELPLSRRLSGWSRCDRTELILVIGVWGRGCMGFCDFPGPSLTDGGAEIGVMSRKE